MSLKKNNTTYIVHDNLRGDVEVITDTSGNIVAQAHYDPWGNQVSASGSLVQPMRYAGYYYDDETGLYYLKSRYYSPVLVRFLTRDGIGFIKRSNPQTLNLYSYCGNNPVSLTDPNGNWASEAERKWAKAHWSKKDYDAVDNYGKCWKAANETMKSYYKGKADEIREKYPAFHETKTIEQSVRESKPATFNDLWKGMSDQGWKPYKQTAGAVAIGGAVIVTGGLAGSAATGAGAIGVTAEVGADIIAPMPTSTLPGAMFSSGNGLIFGFDWD